MLPIRGEMTQKQNAQQMHNNAINTAKESS